jgi:hypothetical protein
LTCLAPLAAWQSLCTGHVDAPLENSVARAFTDRDRRSGDNRYFRQPCVGALASLARQRGQLVNRREAFRPETGFRDVRDALRERTLVGLGEREFYRLDQAYTGRLWTLPTVDYVDGDSLALHQARDPCAVQRRSVHKDILAAPI